jgi:DNA-binding transcriptional MocR family regulator
VFRSYQADVVHVPMDHAGLVPEALDETLAALQRQGRRVKLLYTVPNHHNPAGVTLSAERRPQIVAIAKRYGVLILEDDPYGLLGFEGDPLPSLHSHDPEAVIYLGSFSKTFAPGFRVGWAVAPHAVREKLVLASESSILCPSAFSQLAVSTYLDECDWRAQVEVFRALYRERAATTLAALADLIPQATWTTPRGGFYVWVTLPEGLDATSMLPRAVSGAEQPADLVLLSHPGADPRRRAPVGRRRPGRARGAEHVRAVLAARQQGPRLVTGPRCALTARRRRQRRTALTTGGFRDRISPSDGAGRRAVARA